MDAVMDMWAGSGGTEQRCMVSAIVARLAGGCEVARRRGWPDRSWLEREGGGGFGPATADPWIIRPS